MGRPAPSTSACYAAKLTSSLRSPFKHIPASPITMRLHSAVQTPATRGRRRRQDRRSNTRCGIASLKINSCQRLMRLGCKPFHHSACRPSATARLSAPEARCSGCGHWHRRVPMLRHRICGNLFERSAASTQRVLPHRRLNGVTQVAQRRSRSDADCRAVFFCLLCLHEQEKKVACRGETRPLSLATKQNLC